MVYQIVLTPRFRIDLAFQVENFRKYCTEESARKFYDSVFDATRIMGLNILLSVH